ncbi:MAG TPA: xanthine dehydrogenase family protein molybdopterin-binding subunit [Candidatus Cybelea sp.]|nr:xanthine dehydrogenase family protein molybdopterin-binding subunit [Candidatus Cybelea sp.]
MTKPIALDRRQVLTGAAAGALVLGFSLTRGAREAAAQGAAAGDGKLNAWLRIGSDDSVTILVGQSEMGQGVYTSLPMLVAEELECDWSKIKVEPASGDDAYRNVYAVRDMLTAGHGEELSGVKGWAYGGMAKMFSEQLTGGSTSIRGHFDRLREAGAAAREMLRAAAAKQWSVPLGECEARDGQVSHTKSNRVATYGALAAAAAAIEPPKNVLLKPPSAWRLIGKPVTRLDLPAKVTGRAGFGIDARPPGMLFAAMRNCPVFGGKLKSYDAAKVEKMPGVKAVVALDDAVAVVADNSWRARQAAEALPVVWDEGEAARTGTDDLFAQFKAALSEAGEKAYAVGDADATMAAAPKMIAAEYRVPFLAHATMEPMNCTAHVTADGVEIWAATQVQTRAVKQAAEAAGVSESKVKLHTTMLGGGFGRRAEFDTIGPAVRVSKAVGKPVQLLWSREEDMRHDFYRPGAVGRLEAGIGADGMPVAWRHRIASPSIMTRVFKPVTWMGPDQTSVEGAIEMPYGIKNQRIDYVTRNTPVPVGFWRSVGNSQNAYIKECFLDEVAAAGGKDPLELRRALLADAPRHRAVLDLAAEKAGWGTPLPKGRGRGVALHRSFGSIVAEIADVEVGAGGVVKVLRVVCAVDCGTVVNPDTVVAQMQGGIVFGLTAALYGSIGVDKGRVVEGNFDTYRMVRLAETPAIEVYIVPSETAPGGVGEPSVPPIAPAVVNAIFAATGKRLRSLPIAGQTLV